MNYVFSLNTHYVLTRRNVVVFNRHGNCCCLANPTMPLTMALCGNINNIGEYCERLNIIIIYNCYFTFCVRITRNECGSFFFYSMPMRPHSNNYNHNNNNRPAIHILHRSTIMFAKQSAQNRTWLYLSNHAKQN